MKFQLNLVLILVCAACIFGNCNKTDVPSMKTPAIVNLKTKTLSELKGFLNGRWKMHYLWETTIAGRTKVDLENANNFMLFYPVDSILWTTSATNTIISKDILEYKWGKSANTMNDSAFKISFKDAVLNNTYNWTADRTINDTLVFIDNSMVGQ